MSRYTPVHHRREVKPSTINPSAESVAAVPQIISIANAVHYEIPYDQYIYTAELARSMGGNCYAQAEATAEKLSAHEVYPHAIMLEPDHASNVVYTRTGLKYISSGYKEGTRVTSVPHINVKLDHLFNEAHAKFLAATFLGSAACFFWQEPNGIGSQLVDNIGDFQVPGNKEMYPGIHLLATPDLGVDMLHAIGDIKRYRSEDYVWKHGIDVFESAYSGLRDQLPAFIELPVPGAILSNA